MDNFFECVIESLHDLKTSNNTKILNFHETFEAGDMIYAFFF